MSNKVLTTLRRPLHAGLAALLLLASSVPVLVTGTAAAAGQVTARSITMSDSTPGASNVSYKLTFTPVTTAQELIVDFCSDTPFSGATCAFASTSVPTVPTTPTLTASAGTVAQVGSGSPIHTIKVTGLTMTGGSSYTITLGGLTNPSTAATFYARVYTYATSGAASYVPANTTGGATTVGSNTDFGGVALSTATNVSVTAKVMESLAFCVYATSCGSGASISIGAGANGTLDTNAATANVNFSLSTNASSGAAVTLNGDTLKSGSNSIAAVGATNSTIGNGSGLFGVRVSTPGGLTATAPYAATGYALDTNGTTGTTSTFGQQIASVATPVNGSVTTLTYSAAASNTTPAGIYTTNHALVATGKF